MLSIPKLSIFFAIAIGLEALQFTKTQNSFESLIRKRRETSSESVEFDGEGAALFMKFLMAAAWEGDKTQVLSDLLEETTDHQSNVTIIGWQRILDEQDKVKEIRTIQVVIPPKPNTDPMNIVEQEDLDFLKLDTVIPHKKVNKMRSLLVPLEIMGIPGSLTLEHFDEDGTKAGLLYVDKDELCFSIYKCSLYNKTITDATEEEVQSFIKSLKPSIVGKPSVLKYDTDGHLIPEQSNIEAELLGYVVDHYEATEEMLREAPKIIAQIAYKYPQNEIPKQLVLAYNKAYPDYKWRVLVDPTNYYITRDLTLTLSYDNFDFYETSDVKYLLIANKK